jgi:hypothetical protein
MEVENDAHWVHECGRKKKYLTRKEARMARAKYNKRFHDRIAVYRCSYCNLFHLGHRAKGDSKCQ